MKKQEVLAIFDEMEKETENNIGFVVGHVTKASVLKMIRDKREKVENFEEDSVCGF